MSTERKLDFIEKDYLSLRIRYRNIENLSSFRTQDYIMETIKLTLKFNSDLELLYEDVKEIADQKVEKYFNRIERNINVINRNIRGQMGKLDYYKGAIDLLNIITYEDYGKATDRIKFIRKNVYEFCEDIRLLYALKVYPLEEKIKIKSDLSDHGFIEVVKSLDEIDDNLLQSHHKDALGRGRDALEKLISGILIKMGKTPSNRFSTDIGTLGSLKFIDRENKKLIEATFSLLSEVGSHGRGSKNNFESYAKYALKELYMKIDKIIYLYEAQIELPNTSWITHTSAKLEIVIPFF